MDTGKNKTRASKAVATASLSFDSELSGVLQSVVSRFRRRCPAVSVKAAIPGATAAPAKPGRFHKAVHQRQQTSCDHYPINGSSHAVAGKAKSSPAGTLGDKHRGFAGEQSSEQIRSFFICGFRQIGHSTEIAQQIIAIVTQQWVSIDQQSIQ